MRKYITEKLEVDSEAINHMIYDYDLNTLTVKFNYGKEYMYFKVPSDTFISMKYSESIGKFFNHKIKKQYNFA
mgnify:FL=1|tara:strand:+ start:126 stop:344 length:219 start_codon:yes stop_codon:yes gene_type:complete